MRTTKIPLKTRCGATIGGLYPLLSGCGSFANSKLMCVFDPDSPLDVSVKLKGGYATVPTNDYVGRAMLFVGDLDRKISKLVETCVQPGDVALDIGANLGLVSLQLAHRVGSQGCVHAFEPSPRLEPYLASTIAANPTHNIVLHKIALGREKSTLPLFVPADNAGAATLRSDGRDLAEAVVEVPVHPLSEYASQNGLDRVDFIKIDVEGFEAEVILGAVEFLESVKPKVLVLEEHAPVVEGSLPPALCALADLSYDIYALPRRLMRFELVPISDSAAKTAHDYVAISRSENTADIRERLNIK